MGCIARMRPFFCVVFKSQILNKKFFEISPFQNLFYSGIMMMKILLKRLCLLVLLLLPVSLVWGDSVRVVYPNGGEVLKIGSTVRVRWNAAPPGGNVVLVLYKKGIKHSVISKKTPDTGLFTWTIPPNIPQGTDYRIRIRLAENLSVNDFSDRDFTIKK